MRHPQKPEKSIRASFVLSNHLLHFLEKYFRMVLYKLNHHSFTKEYIRGSRFLCTLLAKTVFPEVILACAWLT